MRLSLAPVRCNWLALQVVALCLWGVFAGVYYPAMMAILAGAFKLAELNCPGQGPQTHILAVLG